MAFFFIFFFGVYAAVNYYIFRRMRQSLEIAPTWFKWLMSIIYVTAIISYFVAKAILANTCSFYYDFFLYAGAFGFAVVVYVLQILIILDLGRFIIRKSKYNYLLKDNYPRKKFIAFITTIILTGIIITAGEINADDIVVNELKIELSYKDAPYNEVKLMFFSDLHLSPLNDERQMDHIIKINKELKPDIILMGGDIVDDTESNLYRDNVDILMKKLYAPKGVYTILGNHEYIVGAEKSIKFLKECKINVIKDSVVVFDDFLQIAGRDDFSSSRFGGNNRKELTELLKTADRRKPLIMLDHQPHNLSDVIKHKIDIQLSGHTHHGQMFPGNLITSLIYEISYGYKKIGGTIFYVSSGVGTWGPPIRLGSKSEVVLINLKFIE
ncbi:MAG: metallophosphoesterase [Ignavibacteriaceae bacterium]